MTKKTINRLFPNKKYCISHKFGEHTEYWERDCMWYVDDKTRAYVGTKRELEIILNKQQFQMKLRGARVTLF